MEEKADIRKAKAVGSGKLKESIQIFTLAIGYPKIVMREELPRQELREENWICFLSFLSLRPKDDGADVIGHCNSFFDPVIQFLTIAGY
ncbi:MAG: hypothetical protein ABSC54_08000 [Smithellaceae bacterium]